MYYSRYGDMQHTDIEYMCMFIFISPRNNCLYCNRRLF